MGRVLAADIDEFLRSPADRYVVSRGALVWCGNPSLCGSVHWGWLGSDDLPTLTRLWDVVRQGAMRAPIDVILDGRELDGIDVSAQAGMLEYLSQRLDVFGRSLGTMVVLLRPGLTGAVVAGLYPSLGPSHAVRIVRSTDEALTALPRDDLARALQDVERHVTEARARVPTRDVAAWLARNLKRPSLTAAARALGTSTRSLQRALGQDGTSFSAEVIRARVRAAQALLVGGNAKLESIARDVGFASPSHFALHFRKLVGESPSEFRERASDALARS